MWKPLNMAQTDALFESEAVLLGTHDMVPLDRVRELLCEEALDFARHMVRDCVNGYGIGDYTAFGMYKNGFRVAVTWMNVKAIQEKEDPHGNV